MRKLLSRTVILLSLVSLFTDMSSELLYPVLPVYLQQLGFSVIGIGLLEGFANVIIGLSTGYFGAWSDKSGNRMSFVRAGYFMSAIGKPMMIVSATPVWIYFSRLMERLGKGVRTGARDAMLLDAASEGSAGRVFGFHRAMDTTGAVIGPLAAVVYLYFFPGDYRSLFIIAFFPALVGVIFTLRIKNTSTVIENTNRFREPLAQLLSYPLRANAEVRKILFGVFLFSLFNSADAFIFMMCKHKGLNDGLMIGGYIGYNLVYAALAWPIGLVSDRVGARNVFVIGIAFFAAAYIGFMMPASTSMLIFSFLLYGLFSACTEGVSKAWISNHVESGDKALAFGFLKATVSITFLIASALTGLLWEKITPEFSFLFAAFGGLLSGLYLFVFTPKS